MTWGASSLLLREDGFRNHAVNALADVHHLGDPAVRRHRRQRIGLVAAHRRYLLGSEEIHRLPGGDLHRLVEILIEAHGDPVGLRLGARPLKLHALVDDGLDLDLLEGALERGEIHLAVPLPAMGVTGPDQSTLEKYRDGDARALLQLVEVHVRSVFPWAQRAGSPLRVFDRRAGFFFRLVWMDADGEDSRKRLQVEHHPGLELGLPLLPIELVVLEETFLELGRQQADGRKLRPGEVEVGSRRLWDDLQNANLHHVAGLGLSYEDGPVTECGPPP